MATGILSLKNNNSDVNETAKAPTPALGKYKTERYGHRKEAFLVGVKKDVCTLKDDLNRTDSYTISLAKFLKLYVKIKD